MSNNSFWQAKGNYKNAIDYYEEALQSDLKTFGENHIRVKIICNSLNNLWQTI